MQANELYEIYLEELEGLQETLGRKFKVIHPKVFSYWLIEGEADIRTKTGILEKYTDITILSGTKDYALPVDFSRDTQVESSTSRLTKRNISEILLSDLTTNSYAFYLSGGRWYIRVSIDATVASLRVHYISGTSISANAADYFDGNSIANDVSLPDEAIQALKTYLISKVVPEYKPAYLEQLQELINLQALRQDLTIRYKDISLDTQLSGSIDTSTSSVWEGALNIQYVNTGENLVTVQATITDASASNRYTIYFMPGASIGSGWTANQYIDVVWIGGSSVGLDFEGADLTNGIRSLYGLNAIGADFTGCTITLTKAQFLDTIAKWNATTTIWTDGASIGT